MAGEPVRTVVIRGPLSVDEVKAIVAIVRDAEERYPSDVFSVAVDDSGNSPMDTEETLAMLRKINPGRPGYKRITEFFPRDSHDC